MPGVIPNVVWGYRITHYRNLPYILRNGLFCPSSDNRDADYINIGKKDIINKREAKAIEIEPFGRIHDYVSFYFAPRSPMLYSIHKGKSDTECSQSEIVYIVVSIPALIEAQLQFIFTTGQAIMELSTQHNNLDDLDKIDWDIMKSQYWNDEPPEFPDRRRKRMAELLIHGHIPVSCIGGLVTCNAKMKQTVEKMVYDEGLLIRVKEIQRWYY